MGTRRKTPVTVYMEKGPVLTYLTGADMASDAAAELMNLGLRVKLAGNIPEAITRAQVTVTEPSKPTAAIPEVTVTPAEEGLDPGWD